ncbi:hypothetical protein CLIM01_13812 [Colletotrichum limetticola]|uniref:Uncharacterized protein n=1 Tax=Colletotrichum limetticola TaxID=1209924 RepID=A0ABQ9P9R4_9PEZI|nr:hypothetical protein CLIM01_13812 [Colletotrichum limetticola]
MDFTATAQEIPVATPEEEKYESWTMQPDNSQAEFTRQRCISEPASSSSSPDDPKAVIEEPKTTWMNAQLRNLKYFRAAFEFIEDRTKALDEQSEILSRPISYYNQIGDPSVELHPVKARL